MAKYALVSPPPNNSIIEFREYETPPDAVTSSTTKPRLLPIVTVNVTWDPATQERIGPTYTVEETQVVETYTVRVKTAGEISAMKTAKVEAIHREADRHLLLTIQQQIRSLSRLLNLLYRHTTITSWPQAQQDAVATHLVRLDTIDNVRAIEDNKVGEVEAMTDPAQIYAYDPTTGW